MGYLHTSFSRSITPAIVDDDDDDDDDEDDEEEDGDDDDDEHLSDCLIYVEQWSKYPQPLIGRYRRQDQNDAEFSAGTQNVIFFFCARVAKM